MHPRPSISADRPREFVSHRRDRWMFDGGGVAILMYHKIGPTPLTTSWPGLYVAPTHFARQMDGLVNAGLRAVAYDDAPRAMAAGETGFCVSFDDGFSNAFEHALPILQKRGLRAIQFIVAGRIGGEDEWDHAIGEPAHRLMDDAQIRDWLAAGHEIGAHTLTHPHLTALTRERARAEIFDSRKLLEDRFGVPVRHFCYPYGDQDDAIRDLVGEAGYVTAPTVEFGANGPGVPPLGLRRIMACNPRSPVRALVRRASRLAGRVGRRRETA